jgi:hypothetical protein
MLIPPYPHRNVLRSATNDASIRHAPSHSIPRKKNIFKFLSFFSLFSRGKKLPRQPPLSTPSIDHYSPEDRNVTQRLGGVARRSFMDAIAWPCPPPNGRHLDRSENLTVVRDMVGLAM